MKRFFTWLADKISPTKASARPNLYQTGARQGQQRPRTRPANPAATKSRPEYVDVDPNLDGHIEDAGPGKNVLIRNKYVREDTGTHDTLTILDDSMIDTEEETGIDPYNTGQFDRSKNWDKRFRN